MYVNNLLFTAEMAIKYTPVSIEKTVWDPQVVYGSVHVVAAGVNVKFHLSVSLDWLYVHTTLNSITWWWHMTTDFVCVIDAS